MEGKVVTIYSWSLKETCVIVFAFGKYNIYNFPENRLHQGPFLEFFWNIDPIGAEVYSDPWQTFKIERFAKIVKS